MGCVCVGGDLTEHLKVLGVPTPLRLGKQGRRTRHVGDVRDNQAALPSLERAADPVAAAFRHEHEDRRESLPTGPGTSGWHRRRLDAERGRPRCPLRGARGRLRHGQNGPRLVLGPSGPSPHWLSLWAEPCPHRALVLGSSECDCLVTGQVKSSLKRSQQSWPSFSVAGVPMRSDQGTDSRAGRTMRGHGWPSTSRGERPQWQPTPPASRVRLPASGAVRIRSPVDSATWSAGLC